MVLAPIAALLVVIAVIVGVVQLTQPSAHPKTGPLAQTCPRVHSVLVGRISVPSGPIAGYCQPQLENAAQIIRAARGEGLGARAQAIGVMTAIGESGLRNIDFGDTAGPDSRGLFQQRRNWGPLSERMDPYLSSVKFYQRMLGVPNFATREPTDVAHTIQANADPEYYTQFWVRAQLIVAELDLRTDVAPWE